MVEKKFKLVFDGFWKDKSIERVPAKSGIYCVYTYTLDELNKKATLKIHRLIFIGETDNALQSVTNHEKSGEFKKYAGERQNICYSFAPLAKEDRELVKTVLITTHNPHVKTGELKKIDLDKIHITCEGQSSLLKREIKIEK